MTTGRKPFAATVALGVLVALVGCKPEAGAGTGIRGKVTYDALNALDQTEGGPRIDYSDIQRKPARRIVVEAINGSGTVVASTTTNDDGDYVLELDDGAKVKVRASAWLKETAFQPDGIGPENCTGGSWDVRAVDNTRSKAQWAVQTSGEETAPAAEVNLHAQTTWGGSSYSARNGAPFFLIDRALDAIEKVCQGIAAPALPRLNMNWSPDNVATTGDKTAGQITTSHYTTEGNDAQGNLYILGKADSDTDEYDDHVVTHEFGHYLEDKLYRSDSPGGPHSLGNILDPRLAFGEGYGNAMSAIVTDDPVYVDTAGSRQANGFNFSMNTAPTQNDRGLYSELSMQHFLFKLYSNRASYDRIHTILSNYHRTTPALTSGQTFAAYYNDEFGNADGLHTLWGTTLDSPTNSLCAGTCSGSTSDVADPFDVDNDLGTRFASSRTYKGGARSKEFWQLYKPLTGTGFTAASRDDHDQIFGAIDEFNRFGAQRFYRYQGSGTKTFNVTVNDASVCQPDNQDYLDFYLIENGQLLNDIGTEVVEGATAETCETLTHDGLDAAKTYVIIVGSYYSADKDLTSGYGITIQ